MLNHATVTVTATIASVAVAAPKLAQVNRGAAMSITANLFAKWKMICN